ncbi:MAG: hypothetical protein WCI22_12890 [Actinomycetota bacterium]
MNNARHVTRRPRFGRWPFVAATAVAILALGSVATSAAAYSGPPDFQTMGGGVGTTVPDGLGAVYASVDVDGTVYIGGDFLTAGGASISNVAMWTGTAWAAVGTPADGRPSTTVYAMATDGTNLYVGGDFGVYEYSPGSNTWADLNWPNFAYALAWYDDGTNPAHLVAGGGGGGGGNLCRFASYNGTTWTTVTNITSSITDCGVHALAVMDHVLYVGGTFTDKGVTAANNLLAYDGAADTWSPVNGTTGNGVDNGADVGGIYALAAADWASTLVIGGLFNNASGTSVNGVAAYHTGAFADVGDSATNFGVGSEVDSLLVTQAETDFTIIAGGAFVLSSGDTSLVSWLPGGTSWDPGGTGTDGFIDTILLLSPTSLLIGGEFSTAYSIATNLPVADTMGVAVFAPGPVLPTWNTPVTLTGTPKVGNLLTAHTDATGDPTPTLSYVWFRCDRNVHVTSRASTAGTTKRFLPDGCTVIAGATASTYKVTTDDVGKYIGVYAEASNIAGNSWLMASAAIPVPAAPTPTTTPVPPTTEPTLPATGSGGSLPWAAFGITGLGVALLVPARRRWLR